MYSHRRLVMSYIRSTTNPEQLYIWGDRENVYFVQGPNSLGSIPKDIFHAVLSKSLHEDEEKIEIDGVVLKQVWVDADNRLRDDLKKEEIKLPVDIKIELSYNGWFIRMWYVTWEYILSTNRHKYDK